MIVGGIEATNNMCDQFFIFNTSASSRKLVGQKFSKIEKICT